MNRIHLTLCSVLLCATATAQNVTVKGRVTANGEDMPGVTVSVKGSKGGYNYLIRWELLVNG